MRVHDCQGKQALPPVNCNLGQAPLPQDTTKDDLGRPGTNPGRPIFPGHHHSQNSIVRHVIALLSLFSSAMAHKDTSIQGN